MSEGIAQLTAIVGDSHVLTDASLMAGYSTDWTGRYTGTPLCVVRPANTGEVVQVVKVCSALGQGITVQGGNTSLVAGATPRDGDLLMSLSRLDTIEGIDLATRQVTAGAGVTLASLQAAAVAAGLDFGVDLAARDSASVGGMVATNAGGLRVLRHGTMKAQLMGAEIVLADGSVISRLDGLAKQSAGLDLVGLMAGSEGTLGIITKARLRLVEHEPLRAVAVLAVQDTQAAVDLLPRLHALLPHLSALELFYSNGVELVRSHFEVKTPFAPHNGAYLLIECSSSTDPTSELLRALGVVDAIDAAVASGPTSARSLWALRELHTDAINAEGIPLKFDVGVPIVALAELVASVPDLIEGCAPGARVVIFGHLNEGNLHINVLGADGHEEAVTEAVLRSVAERGGTISAEHGIGRAKSGWLHLTRDLADVAAMRSVKRALDPQGLLNAGVLLES